MLASVTRDQSSRRRAPKAASSQKPNQPYTACNPSASTSRGVVRIPCPVVVAASSPTSKRQLAVLQRFGSKGRHSHAQPARLRYADLCPAWPDDHHSALDARFHLDPSGSISSLTTSRRSRQVISAPHLPWLSDPQTAETASQCPLTYRSLSKVIKYLRSLLIAVFRRQILHVAVSTYLLQ